MTIGVWATKDRLTTGPGSDSTSGQRRPRWKAKPRLPSSVSRGTEPMEDEPLLLKEMDRPKHVYTDPGMSGKPSRCCNTL